MWDTRIPVPDVPVVPALSLLFVHAVLRTAASVRTSIAVPTSLVLYIASLPVMVRALRDLEFLAWIDQIRILDEVFVGLVDPAPLAGVPVFPLGDFRKTVAVHDDVRLA